MVINVNILSLRLTHPWGSAPLQVCACYANRLPPSHIFCANQIKSARVGVGVWGGHRGTITPTALAGGILDYHHQLHSNFVKNVAFLQGKKDETVETEDYRCADDPPPHVSPSPLFLFFGCLMTCQSFFVALFYCLKIQFRPKTFSQKLARPDSSGQSQFDQ